MRSKIAKGESFIVIGVAAALIAICVAGLGSFLAHAEGAEADTVHDEALPTADLTLTDEVTAPEGLTVKVDTRGIDLPEDAVSAQYAVAVAADIAERFYGHAATGRAQAVLYDSNTTTIPDVDLIHGLNWNVLLEVDGGTVSATVEANTGIDRTSDLSPFDSLGWTQAFDAWDDQVADGGTMHFGTEQELIEQHKKVLEEYGENYGKPLMSEEETELVREDKRTYVRESIASTADYPHIAQAVEIANERDLGNGATAESGSIVTSGGGGPLDQEPLTYYVVDVALSDGTHLFMNIGEKDQLLYGFTRCPLDYLTFYYG